MRSGRWGSQDRYDDDGWGEPLFEDGWGEAPAGRESPPRVSSANQAPSYHRPESQPKRGDLRPRERGRWPEEIRGHFLGRTESTSNHPSTGGDAKNNEARQHSIVPRPAPPFWHGKKEDALKQTSEGILISRDVQHIFPDGGAPKEFAVVPRRHLPSLIQSASPHFRNFYVVVPPDVPVDLYMDIDQSITQGCPAFSHGAEQQMAWAVLAAVQAGLMALPQKVSLGELLVLRASTKSKYSLHVHAKLKDGWMFRNTAHLKAFMQGLQARVGPADGRQAQAGDHPVQLVDLSVYSRYANMRLPFCTKYQRAGAGALEPLEVSNITHPELRRLCTSLAPSWLSSSSASFLHVVEFATITREQQDVPPEHLLLRAPSMAVMQGDSVPAWSQAPRGLMPAQPSDQEGYTTGRKGMEGQEGQFPPHHAVSVQCRLLAQALEQQWSQNSVHMVPSVSAQKTGNFYQIQLRSLWCPIKGDTHENSSGFLLIMPRLCKYRCWANRCRGKAKDYTAECGWATKLAPFWSGQAILWPGEDNKPGGRDPAVLDNLPSQASCYPAPTPLSGTALARNKPAGPGPVPPAAEPPQAGHGWARDVPGVDNPEDDVATRKQQARQHARQAMSNLAPGISSTLRDTSLAPQQSVTCPATGVTARTDAFGLPQPVTNSRSMGSSVCPGANHYVQPASAESNVCEETLPRASPLQRGTKGGLDSFLKHRVSSVVPPDVCLSNTSPVSVSEAPNLPLGKTADDKDIQGAEAASQMLLPGNAATDTPDPCKGIPTPKVANSSPPNGQQPVDAPSKSRPKIGSTVAAAAREATARFSRSLTSGFSQNNMKTRPSARPGADTNRVPDALTTPAAASKQSRQAPMPPSSARQSQVGHSVSHIDNPWGSEPGLFLCSMLVGGLLLLPPLDFP